MGNDYGWAEIARKLIMFYAELFACAALSFYTTCFFPQIFKNYREKSTNGLSNLLLLSYYIAYGSTLYYVFYCDLIWPYKIMVPVEMTVMSIMIAQKFYYHGIRADKFFWAQFLIINALMIGIFPLSLNNPYAFGMGCGWVSCVFFSLYPVPQVIKLFRTKSIVGFSFGFVTVQFFAFIFEGIAAVLKHLPLPTVVLIGKGFVFYAIFCYQFWAYRKKDHPKTIVPL